MILDRELFEATSRQSGKFILCSCDRCGEHISVRKCDVVNRIAARGGIYCLGCANIGRVHSQETKDKISTVHKGKPKSREHRKKLSLLNSGKTIPAETRERMSESQKARVTDEMRQQVSLCHKGRKHTENAKQKMRDNCRRGTSHPFWKPDRDQLRKDRLFKGRCRRLVSRTLECLGQDKVGHTVEILGYTALELQTHLMGCPSWSELQLKHWEIDHIYPIKAFLDHGIYDVKLINSLENLQPLTKRQNLQKTDKYDVDEFRSWLSSKDVRFAF